MELISPRMQAVPIQSAIPISKADTGAPATGGIPGQISLDEALKGGETAKMDTISMGRLGDTATAGNQVSLGSLLEAKLCLEIIDSLIPSALVVIFYAAKIQLNKSVFQLTAKEKDALTPILQKCLESVNLNFDSPWTALLVTAGAIYISKIGEHGIKAQIDKKTESKKNASAAATQNDAEQQALAKAAKEKSKINLTAVKEETKNSVLRPWDEDDVKKVIKKRRKGPEDARKWLTANWEAIGGSL